MLSRSSVAELHHQPKGIFPGGVAVGVEGRKVRDREWNAKYQSTAELSNTVTQKLPSPQTGSHGVQAGQRWP